jgi:CheY-like chemotaxis protein
METEKRLKILMVEDNPDDIVLIERVLRKAGMAFDSLSVNTRDEFDQARLEFKPDVILSDHALPQFNSIEALEICMRDPPGIPFILVTGTVSDEFAITCLKRGAKAYILKSNLSLLPSAIREAIKAQEVGTS